MPSGCAALIPRSRSGRGLDRETETESWSLLALDQHRERQRLDKARILRVPRVYTWLTHRHEWTQVSSGKRIVDLTCYYIGTGVGITSLAMWECWIGLTCRERTTVPFCCYLNHHVLLVALLEASWGRSESANISSLKSSFLSKISLCVNPWDTSLCQAHLNPWVPRCGQS
jgi:hypothetical protein